MVHIQHVRIIEGHVVSIAAKDNEIVPTDQTCVSVSCRRSFSPHMEEGSVTAQTTLAMHSWRLVPRQICTGTPCRLHIIHTSTLRFVSSPLTHGLVGRVKVGDLVRFDEERALHLGRNG